MKSMAIIVSNKIRLNPSIKRQEKTVVVQCSITKLLTMAEKQQKLKLSKKEKESTEKRFQWFRTTTDAIRANNLARLDTLIVNGINKKDKNGRTLLHEAASSGNDDVVSYLLKNGADVLQTTNKGFTPLHVAALEGHIQVVYVLLADTKDRAFWKLLDARTRATGETAHCIARRLGFHGIAKVLEHCGASIFGGDRLDDEIFRYEDDDEFVSDFGDEDGFESRRVCEFEDEFTLDLRDECDRIKSLMSSAGKDSRIFFLRNYQERELDGLLKCTEKLQAKIKKFVDEESSIDLKEGSYILNCALELVETFECYSFGRLGDVNIAILRKTLEALQFDESRGYSEIGGEFKSKGDGTRYHRLLTSTDEPSKQLFIECVNDLIDKPVKSFIKSIYASKIFDALQRDDTSVVAKYYCRVKNMKMDINGKSFLHIAVLKNSEKMVRTLLEQGVSVRQTTANTKSTALNIAAAKGYLSIVEILFSYNKSRDFVDAKTTEKSSTALHAAAKHGHLLIVKSLLANGANYCVRDADGRTASDLSSSKEIIAFFKLIDELFDLARKGSDELAVKLRKLQRDSLLAVANARNSKGRTLVELAEAKGHTNVVREIKQVVSKMEKIRNRTSKRK